MNRGAQIPINVERCYFKRVWRAPQTIAGIVRHVRSKRTGLFLFFIDFYLGSQHRFSASPIFTVTFLDITETPVT